METKIDTDTHNKAVQAGCSKLLEELQKFYRRDGGIPDLGIELVSRPGEASSSNAPAALKNKHQEALITYLELVKTELNKEPISDFGHLQLARLKNGLTKDLAPIINTAKVVDAAVLNKKLSLENKQIFLNVVLGISKNYPGDSWNQDDVHWSKNQYYDAETDDIKEVAASPAETLNLVCKALLDKPRMLLRPEDDEEIVQNQRIERLVEQLTRLEKITGERNKCTTGVQHDLLTVLDGSFLINGIPIDLAVNETLLLNQFFADFISEALSGTEPDFIVKWIQWLHATDSSDDSPVLQLLRKIYPSEGSPDAAWMKACEDFITEQGNSYGLNPADYKPSDYVSVQMVNDLHISSIKHPAVNESLYIASSILEMQSMQNLSRVSDESAITLIDLRNKALESFKDRYTSGYQEAIIQSSEASYLHSALSAFDGWNEFRQLGMLVGAEDQRFQEIHGVLQEHLLEYFTDYKPGSPLSKEFKQTFKDYKKQAEKYQQGTSELIKNFFAIVSEISPEEQRELFNKITDSKPELFLLQDEALDTIASESLYREGDGNIVMLLTPEVINRVFIHGMIQPTNEWSPKYCEFIATLTEWLLQDEQGADHRLQAFRRSYPQAFLENMQWISHVNRIDSIEPEIKEFLTRQPENCDFQGLFDSNFHFLNSPYFDNLIRFLGILGGRGIFEQRKKNTLDALNLTALLNPAQILILYSIATSCPESMRHLVPVLEKLDRDELAELLLVKNRIDETILHIAAHHPESMRHLVPVLKKLEPDTLAELLQIKNKNGFTVLHIAAGHPESMKHLVPLLEKLETDTFAELLQIQNGIDATILHIAAIYPESMKHLVPLLEKLKTDTFAELLQIQNRNGDTVLHKTARCSKSMRHLVPVLEKFKQEALAELLQIKNKNGDTVLHIAASPPGSMRHLVPVLEKLEPDTLAELLRVKNKRCYTILDLLGKKWTPSVRQRSLTI